MEIQISGQYAQCSRGKICAKHVATGEWAPKMGSRVVLSKPGKWMLSQNDGFSRKDTVYATVGADGAISGLGSRFWTMAD
jgi:hypothetical protein